MELSVYRNQGKLSEAVAQLRQVVSLDEQVQHLDLEADREVLQQVEQEWRDTQT